jgi:hypothetical protein
MSTPPELEPYREQARELTEAIAKVKGIHEQTATVTQQRENVLQQRQRLLDSFEDESAVAELSKLAARVEMADAKLTGLASKLAGAEAELKQALETFGTSFKNLHSALSTFLFKAALDQIMRLVHPEGRVRAKATCADLAWMTTAVVEVQPLRIPTLSDHFTVPNPADVLRLAEQSLAKSEALLAEAGKRIENGYRPPEPFTLAQWQATLSQGSVAAAA